MPFDTSPVWFNVGLLSGGLLLGGLLATIVSPTFRFWPHGTRNWTFWVSWTAWTLYVVGLVGIAYLDWWHWYEPTAPASACHTWHADAGGLSMSCILRRLCGVEITGSARQDLLF